MKITFGTGPATLADIAASPRLGAHVEQWPGAAQVQTWDRYGSDARGMRPAGNLGGQLVFTVFASYKPPAADVVTAVNNLLAAYLAALTLMQQANATGDLGIRPYVGSQTITWAGSILRSCVASQLEGVGLMLRYTFETKGIPTVA